MFSDKELYFILLPALGLAVLAKILVWHLNKTATPRARLLNCLKGDLIALGIIIMSLYIVMPGANDLDKLFDSPNEFKSLEDVHAYLKTQGYVLAKLAEVIKWFFFIFVCFFLINFYEFIKVLIREDVKSDVNGLS